MARQVHTSAGGPKSRPPQFIAYFFWAARLACAAASRAIGTR